MACPSLPAMSNPLRAGLPATKLLITRPSVGHFQLSGSAFLVTAVDEVFAVPAGLATEVDFAGFVCVLFEDVGLLTVFVLTCPGDLTVLIWTPDDVPRFEEVLVAALSCIF